MSYRPKHPWRFILITSDGQRDRRMMQYTPALPPKEQRLKVNEQCPIHINYVGCAIDIPSRNPAENCQD